MPNITFPLDVEIRARASSVFDEGTIQRRLDYLDAKPKTPETVWERDYLIKLKLKLRAKKEKANGSPD